MKNFSLLNSPALLAALVLGGPLLAARGQIPWATEAFSRQEKVEFYGLGQYLHQGDTTFSSPFGNTVKMTLDDTGLG
ncbi:MAG TPA: hypothetical protein VNT26_13440, partial [Candidatus Sulfotelmatobacter sp.]|nr:hypothetical protein [Candidatus Sulfotelmatobacter sp.]